MTRQHDSVVDARVIDIVSAFVTELRGGVARGGVHLDHHLERDLAISSLERVELVARLERAFDVHLTEEVLAAAESPRALADAIVQAGRTAETGAGGAERVSLPGTLAVADGAATLVDALRWHVARHPDRVHLVLREESGAETALTFRELWEATVQTAQGLHDRGIAANETVAIMLRTERAFFGTFFGALLAGAVPVPLYPPFRVDRIEEYAGRQVGILGSAEARLLVTFGQVERVARLLRDQVPALERIVTPDELVGPGEGRASRPFPSPAPESGALIQYTSGSTGQPKGVYLTHRNLVENVRAIGRGLEVRDGDVTVSWLPLYHDMGLIGAWLGSLYHGLPLVVMSPLTFLSHPVRWFQAFHDHHGTIAAAPNFAYDLCTRRITDEQMHGLDLRSVRALLNGSEAVLPDTLQRFTARFAGYGLRPEALLPVYGLAECSVGLAVPPLGRPPRIDTITRERFERDGVAEPADDPSALRFVACGRALPLHEMRVVDDQGEPVADRVIGHIEFRGPSVTAGYYRNREATALIKTADGWTRSGDLGYLADGEIFITGRFKDVIIKGGRNIYPAEVESWASDVAGIRAGCVAAFGLRDAAAGTERLVIVAETRERGERERERLRHGVIDRVARGLGMPPDTVLLVPPGAVLKTSSGKIRRSATRDAYQRGTLEHGPSSAARQWAHVLVRSLWGRLARAGTVVVSAVYTAHIAISLTLGLPFLLGGLLAARSPHAARTWLHRWTRAMMAVCGVRIIVTGRETLATHPPCVFVANHASYLDAAVMLAVLPPHVVFVAKAGLVAYPVLGLVIRRCGIVRAERGAHHERLSSADEVSAVLGRGEALFVFPEGTFVRESGLLPFKLGAFRAAAATRVPVVPITLEGTRRMLPDGARLVRPTRLRVEVTEPLLARGTAWADVMALRDEVRARIAAGLDERPSGVDPETALFSDLF